MLHCEFEKRWESQKMPKQLAVSEYNVGWICALHIELAASLLMLDEVHEAPVTPQEDNSNYHFGQIGRHNVVLACLPLSRTGTNAAAATARDMVRTFSVDLILVVGIAGGIPSEIFDLRLGDVVVAMPQPEHGGVVQYDFRKAMQKGTFEITRSLNRPNNRVLNILTTIAALGEIGGINPQQHVEEAAVRAPRFARPNTLLHPDLLFESGTLHVDSPYREASNTPTCSLCDKKRLVPRAARTTDGIEIHHGIVLSGNTLMRNAAERDWYSEQFPRAACFEMESSGLYEESCCIVIRGICDYSDEHKEKSWQKYAALTAAAYAKEVVLKTNPNVRSPEPVISDLVTSIAEFDSDQSRSWDTLLKIPCQILAVSEWFSAKAASLQKLRESENFSSQAAMKISHSKESLDGDFTTTTYLSESIRSSEKHERTSSSYGGGAGVTDSTQFHYQDPALSDFIAVQTHALSILRAALQRYVNKSQAFAYISSWMDSMRNVSLSVPLLLADKIIFIDANETKHTLPLEYFRGWDTFQGMIRERFRTHPGFRKVEAQQYSLSISGRPDLTLDHRTWHTLKARTKIAMDIMFDNLVIGSGACLLCGQLLSSNGSFRWKCNHCAVSFSATQMAQVDYDTISLEMFRESYQPLLSPTHSLTYNMYLNRDISSADQDDALAMGRSHPNLPSERAAPQQISTSPLAYPRPPNTDNEAELSQDKLDALPDFDSSRAGSDADVEDVLRSEINRVKKQDLKATRDTSTLRLFKRARVYSADSNIYEALWYKDQSAVVNALLYTSESGSRLLDRELMAAILSNSVYIVQSLIGRGANPLCRIDPFGSTLRMAVLLRNSDLVYDLLVQSLRQSKSNGFEMQIFTKSMNEALITATQYNRLESATTLLSFGANPFEIHPTRSSPLLLATRLFHWKVLKLFIRQARRLDLLATHEHSLLRESLSSKHKGVDLSIPLTDSEDAELAHCINEMIQGRGKILQSWINARLRGKGPYENLPGVSQHARRREDEKMIASIPKNLPQIYISESH